MTFREGTNPGPSLKEIMETFITRIESILDRDRTRIGELVVKTELIKITEKALFAIIDGNHAQGYPQRLPSGLHQFIIEIDEDIFQHLFGIITTHLPFLSEETFKLIMNKCYSSFMNIFPIENTIEQTRKFSTNLLQAFHLALIDSINFTFELNPERIAAWRNDQMLKDEGKEIIFNILQETFKALVNDRKGKKDETWYIKSCGYYDCRVRTNHPYENRRTQRCPKGYSTEEVKEALETEIKIITNWIMEHYRPFANLAVFRSTGILFRTPQKWNMQLFPEIQLIFNVNDYIKVLTRSPQRLVTEYRMAFFEKDTRRMQKFDVLLAGNIQELKQKYKANRSFYDERAPPDIIKKLVSNSLDKIYKELDPEDGAQWESVIQQLTEQYIPREYGYYLVLGFLLRNIAYAHNDVYEVDKKSATFLQKVVTMMLRSIAAITEYAVIYYNIKYK